MTEENLKVIVTEPTQVLREFKRRVLSLSSFRSNTHLISHSPPTNPLTPVFLHLGDPNQIPDPSVPLPGGFRHDTVLGSREGRNWVSKPDTLVTDSYFGFGSFFSVLNSGVTTVSHHTSKGGPPSLSGSVVGVLQPLPPKR